MKRLIAAVAVLLSISLLGVPAASATPRPCPQPDWARSGGTELRAVAYVQAGPVSCTVAEYRIDQWLLGPEDRSVDVPR